MGLKIWLKIKYKVSNKLLP